MKNPEKNVISLQVYMESLDICYFFIQVIQ